MKMGDRLVYNYKGRTCRLDRVSSGLQWINEFSTIGCPYATSTPVNAVSVDDYWPSMAAVSGSQSCDASVPGNDFLSDVYAFLHDDCGLNVTSNAYSTAFHWWDVQLVYFPRAVLLPYYTGHLENFVDEVDVGDERFAVFILGDDYNVYCRFLKSDVDTYECSYLSSDDDTTTPSIVGSYESDGLLTDGRTVDMPYDDNAIADISAWCESHMSGSLDNFGVQSDISIDLGLTLCAVEI